MVATIVQASLMVSSCSQVRVNNVNSIIGTGGRGLDAILLGYLTRRSEVSVSMNDDEFILSSLNMTKLE